MGSSQKKIRPVAESLEINTMSSTGKGIGRINGKVVFVEKAITGDVVDIEIVKNKSEYSEAIITSFKEFSEHRIEPVCRYFGICGGCNFLNANYQFQLAHKESIANENLKRIGNLNDFIIHPIKAAKEQLFYRNKLEYSFALNPWFMAGNYYENEERDYRVLGFHVKGRFDKIIDIEKCFLQADPSNQIRNKFRLLAKKHELDFYNIKTNKGFIRSLFIRITRNGQTMINVVFSEKNEELINPFLSDVLLENPEITSLYYFINPKVNESISDLIPVHFFGKEFITENIAHINLQIGPKSFLQTNSYQMEILYQSIVEIANIQKDETVYDLFCGVGSIGLYLANQALKVIGIETISESVIEAEKNKILNGIDNIFFETGLVENLFTIDFVQKHGKADVVILDPPRSGLHPSTIYVLIKIKPERIVYVSCNPSTQARDIALLSEDFQLKDVQPIDMFPQTMHVESIALLLKK